MQSLDYLSSTERELGCLLTVIKLHAATDNAINIEYWWNIRKVFFLSFYFLSDPFFCWTQRKYRNWKLTGRIFTNWNPVSTDAVIKHIAMTAMWLLPHRGWHFSKRRFPISSRRWPVLFVMARLIAQPNCQNNMISYYKKSKCAKQW